jgi:thioredoxin
MKRFFIFTKFFFFLSACAQNNSINQLNAIEFNKQFKSTGGTLLDVRTLNEFKNGHIKDAGQLNYYESDFNSKLLLLPKDQPIYLYCNTGYRSKKAAEILVANGYKNVYNLKNGILEWNLNNLLVVVEKDAKPDNENKMEYDEFNALINSGKLVFIDFYAPWCAPCRNMMPLIDSLQTEYKGKITIVKINADASKKLLKHLSVISVPYFVLYFKGDELFTHKGLISRNDLVKLFESNLKNRSHTPVK